MEYLLGLDRIPFRHDMPFILIQNFILVEQYDLFGNDTLTIQNRLVHANLLKSAFCHVGKFSQIRQPDEFRCTYGAVSLLCYDDFRHPRFIRVFVVIIIPVQKHYDIRILLYRTRLTQIREHRPVIVTFFDGS